MSRRDAVAALIVATAAAGLFALAARGQVVSGPDPYGAGRVEITGEVTAVDNHGFTLQDRHGREFRVDTSALTAAPRGAPGDLDPEVGARLVVRGVAGEPLLTVNMVMASALSVDPLR